MRLTRPDVSAPMSRGQYRSFALTIVAFAVVFNTGYGWMVWDEATHAVRTEAGVVGVVQEEPHDTLVVEFTTDEDQPVTAELTNYTGDHAVGERLRIRYLSRDPGNVRLAGDTVVEPVFFVVGGAILAVGIGMTLHSWLFAGAPVRFPSRTR